MKITFEVREYKREPWRNSSAEDIARCMSSRAIEEVNQYPWNPIPSHPMDLSMRIEKGPKHPFLWHFGFTAIFTDD